jgi:hypothetical protein
MSMIGLDLNASRVRALFGPPGSVPVPLPLDDVVDLPLALSLEGRQPVVGRAGAALSRRAPHLAVLDFLPQVGQPRLWQAGPHRLNADQALALVFGHLVPRLPRSAEAVVALPSYLTTEQVELIGTLAEQSGLRLHGSVPTPAAAAVAAAGQLPWSGLALVLDLDGAALTWSAVALTADQARLVDVVANPRLGRAVWVAQLLDFVARRCVRLSRRDPRESPEGEQSLYDQLDAMLELDAPPDGILELTVETPQWEQQMELRTSEMSGACAELVKRAVHRFDELVTRTATSGPAAAVLLTAAAAHLPGLRPALEVRMQAAPAPKPARPLTDLGEGLLSDHLSSGRVHVLDVDGVGRAVHGLVGSIRRGDWPLGHFESAPLPASKPAPQAPQPPAQAVQTGQARLEFEGREHYLSGSCFLMGRDPSCDLVFPTSRYPTVSARHCEILLERAAYVLRDRSRHGTLVNDRRLRQEERVTLQPGDLIRLGPTGPVVRFLGQAAGGSVLRI